ncbi:MAG: hypothetical protein LLG42_08330 [Chloroflexi bacterium]|nr:hypothetical protein [Chloroflexota bacterium]
MLYILIVAAAIVCALQAITAVRLIGSAIWLAAASAMVSILLYLLGAQEVAVIELSVGAGLVTILFVFAINIVGDEEISTKAMIPGPIAWTIILIPLVVLGFLTFPSLNVPMLAAQDASFSTVLWQDRSPDLFLQLALIFTGVLGILGLLAESKTSKPNKESK